MARANILYGGGDAVDYEELTAKKTDVPEGLTFLGHDSDGDPETGTLPDMTNMYSAPGYSSSRPNVPIHQAIYDGSTTDIRDILTQQEDHMVYYDLQGRRVSNPSKGIYITNGKKIIIK